MMTDVLLGEWMSSFPLWGFKSVIQCCFLADKLNRSMREIFDSFNLGCEPAVDFIALYFCLDLESLAVMQDSVAMEMVDNGETHATGGVKEITNEANNSNCLAEDQNTHNKEKEDEVCINNGMNKVHSEL